MFRYNTAAHVVSELVETCTAIGKMPLSLAVIIRSLVMERSAQYFKFIEFEIDKICLPLHQASYDVQILSFVYQWNILFLKTAL